MPADLAASTIRVMSSLAVEVAVNRWIKPAFEAETGLVLAIDWRPTAALVREVEAGARADVIIAIDEAMAKLAAEGVVVAASRTPLAESGLGVGVKAGTAPPDISSVDAFKRALVDARAVAYSKAGASGIYFAQLIARLGIAEAVNARAVVIPMGFTGERVVAGEADIAIQQVSELMSVPGIDVVGPFPEGVQASSTFEAAIFADAKNEAGARALLAALASKSAAAAYRRGGLKSRLAAGA